MKEWKRFCTLLLAFIMLSTAVPVQADAAKFHLNRTKANIYVGKSVKLKVKEAPKAKDIKWSSSNKKVASVSKKGVVTGKKAGHAVIKARLKGKQLKCKITVKAIQKPSSSNSSDQEEQEPPSADSSDQEEQEPPSSIPSEQEVYAAMIALKSSYPEKMPWTNANYYKWNGGIYSGGYGCAGFAFLLSDAAFGRLPARKHTDYSNIRVGDIIRMNYDTHSVIVLEVKSDCVIVAEGNYNSSIHWGREIAISEIKQTGTYVLTRYPE